MRDPSTIAIEWRDCRQTAGPDARPPRGRARVSAMAFSRAQGGVFGGHLQEPQLRRRIAATTARWSSRTVPAPWPRSASTPEQLATPYQVHGTDAVDRRCGRGRRAKGPEADAIVTDRRGIAVGRRHRRLRSGAVRRRRGARHRRRPCRLERGACRRARNQRSPRWSGSAPRREASSPCSARRSRSANYEVGPEFVERFVDGRPGKPALLHRLASAGPRHVRPQRLYRRPARGGRRGRRRRSTAAPMPRRSSSTPTGAPRTAASRTTAGRFRRSLLEYYPCVWPCISNAHSNSARAGSRPADGSTMAERKLDAMLLFAQESMYWLTGYDTFGFCFFQCLVLKADGAMALLTRSADLRQARHTSIIDNIRIWVDRPRRRQPGARPAQPAQRPRACRPAARRRIRHPRPDRLQRPRRRRARSTDFGQIVDASGIVRGCALFKSPAEIAKAAKAASLADDALDAALP